MAPPVAISEYPSPAIFVTTEERYSGLLTDFGLP
jgi:hypothetical protein